MKKYMLSLYFCANSLSAMYHGAFEDRCESPKIIERVKIPLVVDALHREQCQRAEQSLYNMACTEPLLFQLLLWVAGCDVELIEDNDIRMEVNRILVIRGILRKIVRCSRYVVIDKTDAIVPAYFEALPRVLVRLEAEQRARLKSN